ncbi:MAG: dihydroorotate dehydrogenase electron transfer subunit [Peptococcaceae bacterium]|jgi:dihydroorotate dehydrogenase electron transfer subunit|nr:dihydroorotate dehydrogenase electron transfer subunit [Peptococcaceae bacterium]
MAGDYWGKVRENAAISREIYRMTLDLPEIAAAARPGQFVMMTVSGDEAQDPFLRRPFSVSGMDAAAGTVSVHYRAVGRGTRAMARKAPGDSLRVMGPLGRGFWWDRGLRRAALVGGGVGIAPLLPLARALTADGIQVGAFLGAQNKAGLFGADVLEAAGCRTYAATDDGSGGYKGLVTELLLKVADAQGFFDSGAGDVSVCGSQGGGSVFACGPAPMLRVLTEICGVRRMPCQISMEERMACGLGVCMGCAVSAAGADGVVRRARVCGDGPVLDGAEVRWDG